ncbi:MAG: hypothetical protein JWM85_1013 [Acidimicrobiaceae bacterium]|nr:hypothetical protein [Acidimicrobiaceae bacterium]
MPGWVAAPWIGREAAATPGARLLGRALGGRDLALGLGALLAAQHDAPLRGWVEAGLLSDTGDTLATLLAFKKLPRFTRWLILATTLGAVAAAALCAPFLDA